MTHNPLRSKPPVIIPERPTLTKAQRITVWNRENGLCVLCGKPVPPAGPDVRYDHDNMRAISGDDSLRNIFATHERCHADKTEKHDAPRMAKTRGMEKLTRAKERRPGGFRGWRQAECAAWDQQWGVIRDIARDLLNVGDPTRARVNQLCDAGAYLDAVLALLERALPPGCEWIIGKNDGHRPFEATIWPKPHEPKPWDTGDTDGTAPALALVAALLKALIASAASPSEQSARPRDADNSKPLPSTPRGESDGEGK